MILEGLLTTRGRDGRVNLAPMGPLVDAAGLAGSRLHFRPFQGSATYRNLRETGVGVFHTTDDALLIARAALGSVSDAPVSNIPGFPVPRLIDCGRWRAFEVHDAVWGERADVPTRPVHEGRVRDLFGLNRAKAAVLEATILATRLHLLGRDEVLRQIDALRSPVEKTAGEAEREALAFVERYCRSWTP